jgi:hypothetical protein
MLRVELGPKEVAERSCILARCYTAGARVPCGAASCCRPCCCRGMF